MPLDNQAVVNYLLKSVKYGNEHDIDSNCDALRDLELFVQFKKREKQPWRSVSFSRVAGFSLQLY